MVWRKHHHILDFISTFMVVLYVRHTTQLRGSHPLHFHSWIHQNPTPVNRVLHELLLSHHTQQQSRQSMTLTASLPPPLHQNQHTPHSSLFFFVIALSLCVTLPLLLWLFFFLYILVFCMWGWLIVSLSLSPISVLNY